MNCKKRSTTITDLPQVFPAQPDQEQITNRNEPEPQLVI